MSKPHTLHLNRGAARILVQILASTGWYVDGADSYRAGQVLEDPALEVGAVPEIKDEKGMKAWLDGSCEDLPLTEKQRDTLKRCVDHYLKKGGLPPGPYSNLIQRELGMAPED